MDDSPTTFDPGTATPTPTPGAPSTGGAKDSEKPTFEQFAIGTLSMRDWEPHLERVFNDVGLG